MRCCDVAMSRCQARVWTAGVLCGGGGLCDADQNWRGPFLGCREDGGWARIVGRSLEACASGGLRACGLAGLWACAGGCATTLSTVLLVTDSAREGVHEQSLADGGMSCRQVRVQEVVVHTKTDLRWSVAAVSAAVEEPQGESWS